MLILFGLRNRVSDRGAAVAATCPRCHNSVVLHFLLARRWFTLFFVPVIPLGVGQRLLVCPICRWSRPVTKAAEPLTTEMIGITGQWQAGALAHDEYSKRVDAYWAFSTAEPAPDAPPGTPGTPAPDAEAG